jgi:serine/threonine protein kinase
MSDEDELLNIDVSTVISQPGGTPDPVSGVTVPEDGAGIRLGRYTTVRMLGKGGMAEVYLAKQDGPAGFQKTCVVKRMRRVLAEEQRFVDMFLREARVAARLNHAHVVQIFELGEQDGEYFIAMEYLDGISLHRAARRCWANESSMPMEVILRAIADAAQGLHHAHTLRNEQGQLSPLIHRDISPDNLIITRDGLCKVLDFGIAKSEDDGDLVTRTGELKGKIPYMSPEQIKGEPLDGRSDLWALGVTLYWLLTGKRPFDGGSDHMTIDAIIRRPAQSPRELNPLIPVGVDRIVRSLLMKDPSARLATGAELHDRLVAMLGPSAGTGAVSSFANEALNMSALEKNITPGSVLTIVAARPATQWLKRVSEADPHLTEVAQLSSLIPEPGTSGPHDRSELPTQSALARPSGEPDTGSTVTGINAADLLPPEEGKRGILPVAAGITAAVAMLVGALVLVGNSDDPPPMPVSAPQAPVDAPPQVPPHTPRPPAAPAATEAPADAPPAQAQDENADKASAPSPSTSTPEAQSPKAQPPRAKRPAAPRRINVKAKAPKSVVWKVKGRTVGKGSGTLRVPPGTTSVDAVDSQTGGVTTVAVEGGAVDYGSVGRGSLVLRVRPWAKVKIGGKRYGTTPIDPLSLPAGRYTVTLSWEGKVKKLPATIKRGGRVTLKADMRQ